MFRKPNFKTLASVVALAAAFGSAVPVQSGELTIATDPLGTGLSNIDPNIMFILDDSGSMASDYLPDYVNDSHNPTSTTAGCYDAGDDSSGTITGAPDACVFGDPPYNSPDFNTIYYNPDLRYNPGIQTDGVTPFNVQNAANTNNYQNVYTNPYQGTSTTNIVTQYQDRVWCTNPSDAAAGGNCRQNSGYTFPNASFPYGLDSSGNVKYVSGNPYYYRMQTRQFCTNAARTSCFSGSSVTTAMLPFPAPEFCTDQELTNCAAGAAVTSAHVFFGVRWCDNNTTMTNCQRKKLGNFIYGKHLGAVITGTVAASASEGQIRVTGVNVPSGQTKTINGVTIGGAAAITGTITLTDTDTASSVAGKLRTAINAGPLVATYTATQSGADVVITANATGPTPNGRTILVTPQTTGTTSSRGVITISTAGSANTITSVTVNGQQLLSCVPAVSPRLFVVSTVTAQWVSGGGTSGALSRIVAPGGSSSNSKRQATRDALMAAINSCAATPPGGSGPWTATANGNYALNLIAPLNLGSTPNTWVIARTGGVTTTACDMGNTACGGVLGVSSQAATTTTQSMAGGAAAFTGSVRVGHGQFQRTDIVPSVDIYPKAALRTDCAGATCTYEEEMTNFSNWYAFHRTRMMMVKGSVGRAFTGVPANYRVGFMTICPIAGGCFGGSTAGSAVVAAKYLKFAAWDDAQKTAWYTKFYAQSPTGVTPLREALSRAGLIYAGRLGSGLTTGLSAAAGDDPVQYSCQPNFTILSTDGYWNGAGGLQIDNSTAMGNVDNTNTAPYSLQSQGVYDGNPSPAATGTLADVALYYYKTDLRPTMSDTVPPTNKDAANHQHMVTFTIGLGLDGELTFQNDYETADVGDFFDIKQGTKRWPTPVQNAPSALDDLWHAAVNGRGVFFSAKNPEQVAQSLTETLDQLAARVGAGAAAATSNLQPVAGDNFAFTAQYQTVDWIGDLKARTIDLNSGTVSGVQLWSAAEILDARTHDQRRIYTYDTDDCTGTVPTVVPATGCARNRMKHFCMPTDFGAPWCSDGGVVNGLSATEQGYFDPTAISLSQESQWTTGGTTASLVNYIRSDKTNENTGAIPRGAQDLYRSRNSTLGDIVNAQPAYVRKSPFGYQDVGYSDFKTCTEGLPTGSSIACGTKFPDTTKPRLGTVYAASNDGMVHAFETDVNNNPYYQTAGITTSILSDDTFTGNNTGNGVERWTYIPGLVLPTVAQLASEPYSHQYFADGSPTVADVCIGTNCGTSSATASDWRTILVAGLNGGGRGYYALDITNPSTAGVKALWEFGYTSSCVTTNSAGDPSGGPFYGDCNIGLSYANPIVTKFAETGKWVVVFTSGYNNGSSDGNGDGKGYLYIVDAATGKLLKRLTTGNGTAASPSGLARINGWTNAGNSNNTAISIYGGDLDGNLWRFDLDFRSPANANYLVTTKIAQAVDASNNPQPITVKPELGAYQGKRIVLFATGKFLEPSDKTGPFAANENSIYALLDDQTGGAGPLISNVRGASIVARTLSTGTLPGTRTITGGSNPTWSGGAGGNWGWRVDLPDAGERVNVDPQLQLGTLIVASNVPNDDNCTAGGISYLNYLDYATGSYVQGANGNMASVNIGSSLTVGINVIMLPGGKVVTIATTAANQQLTQDTPVGQANFQAKRVSWRELVQE